MVLLLPLQVNNLPVGLTKSIAFFSEFFPDELYLAVLLLLEMGEFGPLELLKFMEVAIPRILKET